MAKRYRQPIPVSRLLQTEPRGPWVRWWPRFPVAVDIDALRQEGHAASLLARRSEAVPG